MSRTRDSGPNLLKAAIENLQTLLVSNRIQDEPPEELADAEGYSQLYSTLLEIRTAIMSFSSGNLNCRVTKKGFVPGSIKALQAALHHLTWQTKMIATGDFTQRVDFMGEFSDSFNGMVKQLDDTMNQLKERTGELDRSNRQLADLNRSIMDSIQYARMIQSSLLPAAEELTEKLAFALPVYMPRDVVGGDFLFFSKTAEGFVLAVIDCTGHGVPGALMTMTLNAVLGNIIARQNVTDPAMILGQLNREIKAVLNRSSGDDRIDNGLDIGLCIYSETDQRLSFAGAKIDLVFISSGNAEVSVVRGDRKALGYRRSSPDHVFTRHDIPMQDARLFCMTSDGLLDQPGGEKGSAFGNRRYQELLVKLAESEPENRRQMFDALLEGWTNGYSQRDDIALFAFLPRTAAREAGL